MGIAVEFNPDLALRNFEEHVRGRREADECLPRILDDGNTYDFLKKGQRNYYLLGEVPLRMTEGDQRLGRPLASVMILEATHFLRSGEVWTRGKYEVVEVFDPKDDIIHFDGLDRRE